MSVVKLRRYITIIDNEKGASALEFALILPILLLLILGIIQFGFIFFHYISITHAAREGARWAALEQPVADVQTKAINAAPGLSLTASNITVSYPNGNVIGEPAVVTVTYKSPIIAPFIGDAMGVAGSDITLLNSATQRIE